MNRKEFRMRIVVDNKITIYEPTFGMIQWAETNLVLNNPDYYKKERLGKWTGNTPKTICLYESYPGKLVIPFGCLKPIYREFKDVALFETQIHAIEQRSYKSDLVPYGYQENAIQAILRAKNGILVMPCGSGKTNVGLDVISRVGGRALWLTHTQDLLNQSKERANNILDIDGNYGTITAGKVNVGSHITFATVQTMCKVDLNPIKDLFDIVVCDEAQHVCGSPTKVTQFYKVISNLSARYKIGLTATPKRADGLEQSMFALLGGIAYEVTRQDVKDTTCPLHVKCIETHYSPNKDNILCPDGTIDYNEVINDLIKDNDRTNVLLSHINSLDGSAMVLANRIEYLETLQRGYNGRSVCLSTLGVSKKAKEQRKQALAKLENGEIDCIFASYKLASEGLDVPNLKYMVFATPEKFETTIIQSAGRVMRKAKGKQFGTVIDFCDDFGMYRSWQRMRKKCYKKLDATIDTVE